MCGCTRARMRITRARKRRYGGMAPRKYLFSLGFLPYHCHTAWQARPVWWYGPDPTAWP